MGDGRWYIVGGLLVSSTDEGVVRGTSVPWMRAAWMVGCVVAHVLPVSRIIMASILQFKSAHNLLP